MRHRQHFLGRHCNGTENEKNDDFTRISNEILQDNNSVLEELANLSQTRSLFDLLEPGFHTSEGFIMCWAAEKAFKLNKNNLSLT